MTEKDFVTLGDGCRLAYRFDGDETSPTLLLSNSLGADMAMWDPQIDAWKDHFRILRYDQRGHGGSAAPSGAYSLDRLGRDVVELLETLGIKTVDFCGLSLGGMTGQWLGIRAPALVRRLVLANSSSFMGPPSAWDARIQAVEQDGMEPLARASVERWFTPEFPFRNPEAVGRIRDGLLRTDPTGYAGCCAAIRDMDMRRTAALVTTPTLVIAGLRDPATPPAHSEALCETIPGARLEMLEAAHLSNVEREHEFATLVLNYLRG